MHSASLLIRSYDFAQIERLQSAGDWEQAGQLLAADAARLQDAGAQILVLATNTMHQVYAKIAAVVSIPFPYIAVATGAAVSAAGLSRVGLLGTRFTMERATGTGSKPPTTSRSSCLPRLTVHWCTGLSTTSSYRA